MDGRWRTGGPNMPERIRDLLHRTRLRTGSGRTVGVGVGVVVAVLVVVVAVSVLLASRGPAPVTAAPGAGAAELVPPATGTTASPSPSASPEGSPSPSDSPSEKPAGAPATSTGEPANGGGGDEEEAEEPAKAASGPTVPGAGTYRVRPAHTGMCLGYGPEIGNTSRTVLVQDSCSQAGPAIKLIKVGADTVRFGTYVKDVSWNACIGLDSPGSNGYLYAPYDCNTGALQTFKLVPAPGGRYLIKSTASGLCMDFPWYTTKEGAQAGSQPCSSGRSSQQFSFG